MFLLQEEVEVTAIGSPIFLRTLLLAVVIIRLGNPYFGYLPAKLFALRFLAADTGVPVSSVLRFVEEECRIYRRLVGISCEERSLLGRSSALCKGLLTTNPDLKSDLTLRVGKEHWACSRGNLETQKGMSVNRRTHLFITRNRWDRTLNRLWDSIQNGTDPYGI
ncbi:hypothetical protein CDAR_76401 [Caerostris darwini]|uniref:Uncharacterized protein n=1 Tax=Caerostris darwini TaxID=1538125 RepID=A0AAV4QDJ2_9ARAC|nr:hypothetical protein CDAR_76401 [Caerostris darwini]